MNERTLQVLEFDKIKLKLRSYATTAVGQSLVEQVKPETDL